MNNDEGLARIHIVLSLLCLALAFLLLLPVLRDYRYRGEQRACQAALRSVNGAMAVEMIERGEALPLDEAVGGLASILPGREQYCPSGGTLYFLPKGDGGWTAVCGLHDPDQAERCRLNASFVLSQLKEELEEGQDKDRESVTVKLNGADLTCRLVTEETGLRRGTSTTPGYEKAGTVAFYGLEGTGSFTGTGAKKGKLAYFCFSDEAHNATWRFREGWRGSAWGDRY